jgi:hypothetical protein
MELLGRLGSGEVAARRSTIGLRQLGLVMEWAARQLTSWSSGSASWPWPRPEGATGAPASLQEPAQVAHLDLRGAQSPLPTRWKTGESQPGRWEGAGGKVRVTPVRTLNRELCRATALGAPDRGASTAWLAGLLRA